MQAFIIEKLFPTGWRRSSELYWRLADAAGESRRTIQEGEARGVRVLAVRINPDAVLESMAEDSEEAISL